MTAMKKWVLIGIAGMVFVFLADYCITGMNDNKLDYRVGQLAGYGAALFVTIGIAKSVLHS